MKNIAPIISQNCNKKYDYNRTSINLKMASFHEMQGFKVHISEKATKFCEIFTLLLPVCTVVKSKVKILQNFVASSEYMNFNSNIQDQVSKKGIDW